MRLIDADSLGDVCTRLNEDGWGITRGEFKLMDRVLFEFPNAERKGHWIWKGEEWIPCSERLPENSEQRYWVCNDMQQQFVCRWTNANPIWQHLETEWHWNIFDTPRHTRVVAWMPLPEPYKAESEDKE